MGVSEHTDFELISVLHQARNLAATSPEIALPSLALDSDLPAVSSWPRCCTRTCAGCSCGRGTAAGTPCKPPVRLHTFRAAHGHAPAKPPSPYPGDRLVVIVGDMLERLSSGYFRATPHRVAATAAAATAPRRRCRTSGRARTLHERRLARSLLPMHSDRVSSQPGLLLRPRRGGRGARAPRLDGQAAHRLRRVDGGASRRGAPAVRRAVHAA